MMALTTGVIAQTPHTPKTGSAERQAICDGLRDFVKGTALKPLPKPVVFKISNLRVLGDYCFIECLPVFKDGSDAVPEFLPDVGYMHCLKNERGTWKVILDLSRTDVPSDGEVREIRRSFPPDFPLAVLSEFWRDLLAKAK
jgi:hypothetical protein